MLWRRLLLHSNGSKHPNRLVRHFENTRDMAGVFIDIGLLSTAVFAHEHKLPGRGALDSFIDTVHKHVGEPTAIVDFDEENKH